MGKRSSKVDEYIARAAPFARPILDRIRAAFHAGDSGIAETMKWSAPHFEKGGLLGSMAAFKAHVRLVLWRGKELEDPVGFLMHESNEQLGWMRLEKKSDLPAKAVMAQNVQESIALLASGKARIRRPRPAKPKALLARPSYITVLPREPS